MTDTPLGPAEIDRAIAGGVWRAEGDTITGHWELADFAAAVAAVNAIAEIAEAAGHHPDLLIHGYRKLTVTLSTHSAGGVTRADLDLAAAIDARLG